jgi:NAD(P)-dependent dehydrogenase (short-subunit alcohol dehydrogenase family)
LIRPLSFSSLKKNIMNILITGSTDGVGKLTAIQFVKEGHNVFVHGRNKAKTETLVEELRNINPESIVKAYIADFSDLESVKKMSKAISKEVEKLDVIINNAGIFNSPEWLSSNGIELRFVVNYLAPYILTNTILTLLSSSDDPRIINLSSAAQAPISTGAILGQKAVSENEAYAISKLALTMWSFYLAEQHKNITTIAVNPGSLLNTKMANEAYGQHWSPAEKGSDVLYDLSVNKEHLSHSGDYFDNDREAYARAHPSAYNTTIINELITLTENIISK